MFESLDEVRTYLRVIDHGSLSAAARAMHLSVNAVWGRLRRIEERAGVRLIERTSRSLRVTELGQRLAQRARRILAELEDSEIDVALAAQRLVGPVRVGLPTELAQALLVPDLVGVLREHPALHLEILRVGALGELSGDLDLLVWGGPVKSQDATIRKIGTLQWVLAAAPSYVSRHGALAAPEDLLSHQCLLALRTPRETSFTLVDEAGEEREVSVQGQLVTDNSEVLLAALHAGLGIGLRPRGEVLAEVQAGRLVHLLPGWTLRPMSVAIIAPPGRLRVPRVRVVADVITRALRRLLSSTAPPSS